MNEATQGNDSTLSEEQKAASVEMHVDQEVQETADALYNTPENSDNKNNDSDEVELKTPDDSSESEESQSESSESSQEDEEQVPDKDEKSDDSEQKEVEYKLELAEDSKLHSDFVNEMTEFAKQHGLSNEAAQELVDWQNETVNEIIAKSQEFQEKQVEDWKQETINDPELGGEKLTEVSEYAKSVVKQFGNEAIIEMLNESGLGNHKEVVRFLSKIGRAMSNDNFVEGEQARPQLEDWEIMYGKK